MQTLTNAPPVIAAEDQARCEIEAMVGRARDAQATIGNYAQEQADTLVTAVGWQVYKSREALAILAVEEGGFGNVQARSPSSQIACWEPCRHGFNQDLWHRRGRPIAWLGQDRQAGSASLPLSFPPRGRTPRLGLRR